MGILGRIGEAKRKFKSYQTDKRALANTQKAQKLESLREDRIRLEGQASLESKLSKEKARIQTAKQNTGVRKKLTGFAKGIKNAQGKMKNSNIGKGSTGLNFGGNSSSFNYGGDRNLDIGGGNSGPGSAFSLGNNNNRQIQKPKPKRVIINIK